jgi:hypothetical protein
MKKSFKLILGIAVLVFAVSCESKTGKIHSHSGAQQEQPATPKTNEHEQAGNEVLQLNNGNLWEANLETTAGIDNMKLLIKSFSERDNMEDYATVKQNLEKEFGTIIAKCTMTGEAHNQLHKYLIPMKDLFAGLTASDLETRKASLNKINIHLEAYTKYFK